MRAAACELASTTTRQYKKTQNGQEGTWIIRLDIKRPQTIPLPVPIAIIFQPVLGFRAGNSNNAKLPKPERHKLVQAHLLVHWIRAAALDLGVELAVQEAEQRGGDAGGGGDGVEG